MSEAEQLSEAAQREADAIMAERTWPYVLELRFPFDFGKRSFTSLTFQKGKLGMMAGMSLEAQPSIDKLMLIAARLAGVPIGVIEALDPDDATEVISIALGFFARCLSGGRT